MNEKRSYGAAAYHPDVGFLITGGYYGGPYDADSYVSSTEVTKDGQSFQVKTILFLPSAKPPRQHNRLILNN